MRNIFLLIASGALLTGCGPSEKQPDQSAATAQPKEKPRYCFFKEDGTKEWSAKRGKDGNIVVTGKAYREDGRYKAVLGEPKVTANRAEVWPSITPNTGYSSPDGWWNVTAIIPGSDQVETVEVRCGKRTLAELKVPLTS